MTHESPLEVALGIVIRSPRAQPAGRTAEAEVLISRRPEGGSLAGYWEFPGGKVEANESAEAAAVRELREELGIDAELEGALEPIHGEASGRAVVLRGFYARLIGGEPEAREVAEWKWARISELRSHRFPPANGPLLEQIERDWAGNDG
ncbi:MAG: NUDIX domain-containing protein [Planctomycetota bacterium]